MRVRIKRLGDSYISSFIEEGGIYPVVPGSISSNCCKMYDEHNNCWTILLKDAPHCGGRGAEAELLYDSELEELRNELRPKSSDIPTPKYHPRVRAKRLIDI